MTQIATRTPDPSQSVETAVFPRDPRRLGLAGFGIGFVGLAGLGVVVPGLPTTIFLILASWCFARSCPWLEERLIRNRFFGPFLRYMEPGSVMPTKAVVVSLVLMWGSIGASSAIMFRSGVTEWAVVGSLLLGMVGTVYIVRAGRPR